MTKQIFRIQDLQDPPAITKNQVSGSPDPTMKQKLRIQDPQDPGSPGFQDRSNFKDPGSAGSHNKMNIQTNYKIHRIPQQNAKSNGPQDLTAKIIKDKCKFHDNSTLPRTCISEHVLSIW